MATQHSKQTRKATRFLAGLCALLGLLALFIYLYDKAPIFAAFHYNPVAGPLEIIVILVGLAGVGLGGAFGFFRMWKGRPKSFAYDVGLRLLITGYLMAFISSMADYFGMGAHHILPYFGPVQAAGVYLGEGVMLIGLFMIFPYHRKE